jgi:hypothetical protein
MDNSRRFAIGTCIVMGILGYLMLHIAEPSSARGILIAVGGATMAAGLLADEPSSARSIAIAVGSATMAAGLLAVVLTHIK